MLPQCGAGIFFTLMTGEGAVEYAKRWIWRVYRRTVGLRRGIAECRENDGGRAAREPTGQDDSGSHRHSRCGALLPCAISFEDKTLDQAHFTAYMYSIGVSIPLSLAIDVVKGSTIF